MESVHILTQQGCETYPPRHWNQHYKATLRVRIIKSVPEIMSKEPRTHCTSFAHSRDNRDWITKIPIQCRLYWIRLATQERKRKMRWQPLVVFQAAADWRPQTERCRYYQKQTCHWKGHGLIFEWSDKAADIVTNCLAFKQSKASIMSKS